MHLAFIAIKVMLIGCTLAANAYYLLSIVAAFKFFSKAGVNKDGNRLPVTIMVPLYGADFEAYENYARFCRQDYPDYQIVFGVRDVRDSSVPIDASASTAVFFNARFLDRANHRFRIATRTIGAITMNRSPSSSAMIWSMICSADWAAIGRPQLKQCGWPTRAHRSRR